MLAAVILFAGVLLYSLFPKTTVASILRLDSKDQVVKVEIGSAIPYPPQIKEMQKKQQWLDVTDTLLGKRYIDALFSTSVAPPHDTSFYDNNVAMVRITISNLPEDYPFNARQYTIFVGGYTTSWWLKYTNDEQMRLQEIINTQGKAELAPTQEYWEFDLSHHSLFTREFIDAQFE